MAIKFLNTVAVDTDVLYVDTASNEVGIGTTSPGSKLEVVEARSGSSASDQTHYTLVSKSTISSGTPGTGGIKVVYDDGTNEHAFGLVAGSSSADFLTSGPMHWYTNSDLNTHSATGFAMTIDTSQRVGIGTTNPTTDLHVEGNALVTSNATVRGDLRIDKNPSSFPTAKLQFLRNGVTSPAMGEIIMNDNPGHQGMYMYARRSSSPYTTSYIELPTSTNYDFEINLLGHNALTIDSYTRNVGIGTTSPTTPLEIVNSDNTLLYLNSSTANVYLRLDDSNSTNGNFIGATADDMHFWVNNTERMRIAANGYVGIGQTNPSRLLHLKADSAAAIITLQRGNANSGGAYGALQWTASDNHTVAAVDARADGDNEGAHLLFHTTSAASADNPYGISERMRITSDGNVGINESNPSAVSTNATTLHIKGSVASKAGSLWMRSSDNSVSAYIYPNSSEGMTIGTLSNHNFRVNTNSSERMRITSAGNVGIGEPSPAERLHISGSVDNDDVAIRIDNDSNDGSSSTPPSAAVLFTTASNNGYVRVFGAPGGTAANHKMDIGATAGSSYLTFSPSASERMRITSSGNVGIGETDPQQKLHVGGRGLFETGGSTADATTSTYEKGITLTGGNMRLVIDTSNVTNGGSYIQTRHSSTTYPSAYYTLGLNPLGGKVGIGTNSPSHKLEVVGDGVVVSDGTDQGIIYLRSDRTDTYIKENGSYQIETAAPSGILFECDSNSNGAGIFNIKRQGSSRFYITDGGNIGLATTSPRTKLDINGPLAVVGGTFTSGTSGADSNSSAGIVLRRGKKIFSGIPSGGNQDFYLRNLIDHDTSNNINIGQGGTGLIGNIYLRPGSSGTVSFFTTGSEAMRIDSSGQLGIGTTNPTARFHLAQALSSTSERMGRFVPTRANSNIYGAVGLRFEGLDYGNSMEFIRTNTYNGGALKFVSGTTQVGSIVIGSSGTTYNTSSDYRLKENIVNLTGGIERVKQLQPKRFNFIQDPNVIVDGFLAHEAQTVVPQAVTGEKDGTYPNGDPIYQGIDQAKIIPLLTAALKEAIAKIENLETRIQTLENN